MASSIDERIVQMTFNNKEFEKGAAETIKTLGHLERSLKMDQAASGFSTNLSKIENSAAKVDLSPISRGIQNIEDRFSTLGIVGMRVLQRLTDAAIDASVRFAKSISIDNIGAGQSKYETQTKAVQTITNATGKSVAEVEKVLQKLAKYTDETSYDFSTMVSSIGKFTSVGVDLELAEKAMEGIANEAAKSGAGIQEANRAMYNFAQALSAGYVKLIDWKSIENANMATKEFKEQLISTAIEMGTLKEAGQNTGVIMKQVAKATKNTAAQFKQTKVDYKSFNETLSEGWLTSDVLIKTLEKYSDTSTEFGLAAYHAAQEALTFTDAINAVKDAVSSSWMQSFKYMFGDLDEARVLWTKVANSLYDFVAIFTEARNELLEGWHDLGGYSMAVEAASNIWHAFYDTLVLVKTAWETVLPPVTAERLVGWTRKIRDFTRTLRKALGIKEEVEEEVEAAATSATTSKSIDSKEIQKEVDYAQKLNDSIKIGSRGKEVKALQKLLQRGGYLVDKYGADGIYGENTKKAVKKLQKELGVGVTGAWDKATKQAAISKKIFVSSFTSAENAGSQIEKSASAASKATGQLAKDMGDIAKKHEQLATSYKYEYDYAQKLKGVINYGEQGQQVKALQEMLNQSGYLLGDNVADGIYGPKTKAAVAELQKGLGVAATGFWNEATKQAASSKVTVEVSENGADETTTAVNAVSDAVLQLIDYSYGLNKVMNGNMGEPKMIARLQKRLVEFGYLADGKFAYGVYGPATRAAVKQLQHDLGVAVTGEWNKETWQAVKDQNKFTKQYEETNKAVKKNTDNRKENNKAIEAAINLQKALNKAGPKKRRRNIFDNVRTGLSENTRENVRANYGKNSKEAMNARLFITELQDKLKRTGYLASDYISDGVYGKETRSAVKRLQKDLGVAVTGVFDKNTKAAALASPKFSYFVQTDEQLQSIAPRIELMAKGLASIVSIIQKIGGGVVTFFKGIAEFFMPIIDPVTRFLSMVSVMLVNLNNSITKSGIQSFIDGIIKKLGPLGKIISNIGKFFSGFLDGYLRFIASLDGGVKKVGKDGKVYVNTAKITFGTFFDYVGRLIANNPIFQNIVKGITYFVKFLNQALPMAGRIVGTAIGIILKLVLTGIGLIRSGVDGFLKWFSKARVAIGEKIAGIAEDIRNGDIIGAIKKAFNWNDEKSFFENAISILQRFVGSIWNLISKAAGNVGKTAGDLIGSFAPGMLDTIKSKWESFVGWLSGITKNVYPVITKFAEIVGAMFQNLNSEIRVEKASNFLTKIGDFLLGLVSKFEAFIDGFIDFVSKTDEFGNKIYENGKAVIDKSKVTFSNFFKYVLGGVHKALKKLMSTGISDIVDTVSYLFDSVFSSPLFSASAEELDSSSSMYVNAGNNFKEFGTTFGSTVKSVSSDIDEASGKFKNAGKNMDAVVSENGFAGNMAKNVQGLFDRIKKIDLSKLVSSLLKISIAYGVIRLGGGIASGASRVTKGASGFLKILGEGTSSIAEAAVGVLKTYASGIEHMNDRPKDTIGNQILKIAVAAVAVASSVFILSKIDSEKALKGLGVFAIILGGMVAATKILEKHGSEIEKLGKGMIQLTGSIGILAGSLWLMSVVIKSVEPTTLLKSIGIISGMVLLLGEIEKKIAAANGSGGAVKIQGVLSMCAGVLLLVYTIKKMANAIESYDSRTLTKAIGIISGLLLELGVIEIVLSAINRKSLSGKMKISGILSLCAGIYLLTTAIKKISIDSSKYSNYFTSLEVVQGLILRLGFIEAAIAYFGRKSGGTKIGGILSLCIGVLALSYSLEKIAKDYSKYKEYENAFSMIGSIMWTISLTSLIMAAAIKLLSSVPITGGLTALANMAIFIVGMTVIISVLGVLVGQIEEWTSGGFGNRLVEAGKALGGFFGAFWQGLTNPFDEIKEEKSFTERIKELGTELSSVVDNFSPFLDKVQGITRNQVTGVKNLVSILLSMSGENIVDSISSWMGKTATGESSGSGFVDFANNLVSVVTPLTTFSNSITGVNADSISSAVPIFDAIKLVAESITGLTWENVKTTVMSVFVGDNAIQSFVDKMIEIAPKLKTYGNSVSGINVDGITDSATVLKDLGDAASEIPRANGTIQSIIGEHDLTKFGNQLGGLGLGLLRFSIATSKIGAKYSADGYIAAIKGLAGVASEIPKTDGAIQWLLGERNLETFGNQLGALGLGLSSFVKNTSDIPVEYDSSAIQKALEGLAGIQSQLDGTGSTVKKWFSGEKDLAEFGRQVSTLGTDLVSFDTSIDSLKFDKIQSVTDALGSLISVYTSAPLDTAYMSQMSWNLQYMLDNLPQLSVEELENAGLISAFYGLGTRIIDKIAEGIRSKNEDNTIGTDVGTVLATSISAITTPESEIYKAFYGAGKYFTEGVAAGAVDKQALGSVSQAAKTVANALLNSLKGPDGLDEHSPSKKSEKIGDFVGKGLIKGLKTGSKGVGKASFKMASTVLSAMMKALDINSPSKETEYLGEMTGEGYANGIKKSGKSVTKASEALGTNATTKVKEAGKNVKKTAAKYFSIDPDTFLKEGGKKSSAESATERIASDLKEGTKNIKKEGDGLVDTVGYFTTKLSNVSTANYSGAFLYKGDETKKAIEDEEELEKELTEAQKLNAQNANKFIRKYVIPKNRRDFEKSASQADTSGVSKAYAKNLAGNVSKDVPKAIAAEDIKTDLGKDLNLDLGNTFDLGGENGNSMMDGLKSAFDDFLDPKNLGGIGGLADSFGLAFDPNNPDGAFGKLDLFGSMKEIFDGIVGTDENGNIKNPIMGFLGEIKGGISTWIKSNDPTGLLAGLGEDFMSGLGTFFGIGENVDGEGKSVIDTIIGGVQGVIEDGTKGIGELFNKEGEENPLSGMTDAMQTGLKTQVDAVDADAVTKDLGANLATAIPNSLDSAVDVNGNTLATNLETSLSGSFNKVNVKEMTQGLIDKINDRFTQDIHGSPTLTPIFDMSNLSANSETIKKALGINAMKLGIDATTSAALANGLTLDKIDTGFVELKDSFDGYTAAMNKAVGGLASKIDSLDRDIMNMKVYLDSDALVAGTVDKMNRALGKKKFEATRVGSK